MERILLFFARHAKGCIAFGSGMITTAIVLAVIGRRCGRADNRVERIAERADIPAPDVLASLPSWLQLPIPESSAAWAGLLGLALLGVWLVMMARWVKRYWWSRGKLPTGYA